MAIIRNDVAPISSAVLLRILLIVIVLGAAVAIVMRVFNKNFQPTTVDEYACKSDPAYQYKDPQRHQSDCY